MIQQLLYFNVIYPSSLNKNLFVTLIIIFVLLGILTLLLSNKSYSNIVKSSSGPSDISADIPSTTSSNSPVQKRHYVAIQSKEPKESNIKKINIGFRTRFILGHNYQIFFDSREVNSSALIGLYNGSRNNVSSTIQDIDGTPRTCMYFPCAHLNKDLRH
jgi:hypothetical protein